MPGAARLGRVAGPLLAVAVTAFAAAQYTIGHPLAPEAWLAIAPLLEARDRAGRFVRVDQQIQALSRPDLQAAADELLDRLRDTPAAGLTTTSRCCWPSSPSPTRQSRLPRQPSGPRARP